MISSLNAVHIVFVLFFVKHCIFSYLVGNSNIMEDETLFHQTEEGKVFIK